MSEGLMWGRLAFAGVFALLVLWLVLMPKVLRGEVDGGGTPVWKRARWWAVGIAVVQIGVYLFLG